MAKKTKDLIILCIFSATLPVVCLISPLNSLSAQTVQTGRTGLNEESGLLDGLTFSAMLGPSGSPLDVKDTLVFKNGTFVSMECEKRCNYPAQSYFTRRAGEKIEFISETRCLTKDAKIVWRGTVDGENIKGTYSWTVNRWYWTIEKDFWFEGVLKGNAEPISWNQ